MHNLCLKHHVFLCFFAKHHIFCLVYFDNYKYKIKGSVVLLIDLLVMTTWLLFPERTKYYLKATISELSP